MTEDVFTVPDATGDEWVDVRMTDPERGEWDVDVVVADGRVQYLDLRIQPELLVGFVECLVNDVDDERAASILTEIAQRQGIELDGRAAGE